MRVLKPEVDGVTALCDPAFAASDEIANGHRVNRQSWECQNVAVRTFCNPALGYDEYLTNPSMRLGWKDTRP